MGVRSIVLRTIRNLPPRTRYTIRLAVLVWIAVVALQFWDSRDRPGARGLAEFVSVALGTLGFLLIGLVQVLRTVTEPASGTPGHSPVVVRQILMSVPIIASLAAVLLASAVVLLIARVWLGTSMIVLSVAVVYAIVAGLALQLAHGAAVRLYDLGQAEANRAAAIESELSAAQLSALQSRMHPHFLFNALNTIASLTRTNPAAAETTVEQLAEALRIAIDRGDTPLSTVADEVRFVRAYLGVEAQRFGDRLVVEWHIDPGTEHAAIPAYTLQPLVENSIKHGIGGRSPGGRITIDARLDGDREVVLAVSDNGDGFERRIHEGTGLGNLRRRLDALFGDRASLTIDRPERGASVTVRIPFTGTAA